MSPEAREDARRRLDAYWARGCAFLGTRYAIMGGAMSWVSERNLVAAISNAGGFGVVACGSLAPDQLAAEIDGVHERCDRPFGVNIIVMHPALDALVATCIERRVGHVVLAGGMPPRRAIAALKDAGTRVVAFAPTLPLARRLARQGIDALIIEGMEAGGHIGPVSTNVLAQEVLPHFDAVPVFVGGGIGRGDALALYLAMGAAGGQLGTRFVCATESIAHPHFKRAMIRANARDARLSVQVDPDFPVIPVRAVANKATERFEAFQRETACALPPGRHCAPRGAARHRAFLGRRAAAGRDRGRCRERLPDGGPERRHGDLGADDGRDRRRAHRPGRRRDRGQRRTRCGRHGRPGTARHAPRHCVTASVIRMDIICLGHLGVCAR